MTEQTRPTIIDQLSRKYPAAARMPLPGERFDTRPAFSYSICEHADDADFIAAMVAWDGTGLIPLMRVESNRARAVCTDAELARMGVP